MLYEVSSGALMICCFVAGLFFHKFWTKSQDPLFRLFSWGFFMLSFERLMLGYLGSQNEPSPLIYLIRLSAYSTMIFAIIKKNRTGAV